MNKKWKWIAGLVFVGILLGGTLALSSVWMIRLAP